MIFLSLAGRFAIIALACFILLPATLSCQPSAGGTSDSLTRPADTAPVQRNVAVWVSPGYGAQHGASLSAGFRYLILGIEMGTAGIGRPGIPKTDTLHIDRFNYGTDTLATFTTTGFAAEMTLYADIDDIALFGGVGVGMRHSETLADSREHPSSVHWANPSTWKPSDEALVSIVAGAQIRISRLVLGLGYSTFRGGFLRIGSTF